MKSKMGITGEKTAWAGFVVVVVVVVVVVASKASSGHARSRSAPRPQPLRSEEGNRLKKQLQLRNNI
jgi:hypothetical protein